MIILFYLNINCEYLYLKEVNFYFKNHILIHINDFLFKFFTIKPI